MAMNRRDFFRGLGAAAVLAATSSYGKLGAATKLELKPAGPAQFAYHESAPSFTKWTRGEGSANHLYGAVRPSEVIIEYKRAVETVLTFKDGPFKPSEVKEAWQAGDLDAAYGGAAGGGLKMNGVRREFIKALDLTRKHQHLTDKAKVLSFKGISRAFLEVFTWR